MFPGAMLPEFNVTPSRRSLSSTLIPEPSPTVSECWAATCTAPIVRTGSLRKRCATRTPSPRRSRLIPNCWSKTRLEPLITSEWAVAVFRQARQAGLLTAYVSNGNGTPQVLEYIHPWIDLYKVDLKSFDDHHYRQLGGRLQPILDTIRSLHQMGVWLEIVTLLIPGFNDSDDELRNLTTFLAGVSPDIPWHVTAFHQDYKMTSPADTRPQDLLRAAAIGRDSGLRYIYAGNLPGRVQDLEDTHCHRCGEMLIQRFGYLIEKYKLTPQGDCPACHAPVPGRWSKKFDGQIAAAPFLPRRQSQLVKILSQP